MCISDLCRSSAVSPPSTDGIGVRVLPASCVLVPKRDACAFLAQQEKPEVLPVPGIIRKKFHFFFCTRPEILPFCTLDFVVATIVAMVFFFAVFAARAPAMGNSADRAWQLSQLVEGVLTAFNPSHGSLSCVKTNCVSFASAQARKLNRSVCFSFPHKVATLWGPQLWPDIVCPNRLGGMMQPAKTAHGAFLAHPSWGPRKAGRLCGERRSSVVIELSCLHGSERYAACFDEVVARAVRVSRPAV